MTIAYTSYLKYVRPYVKDCPREVVINAISQAVYEFCQQTLIWRSSLTGIDTVVSQDTYTLVPPASTRVILPIHVAYDEATVTPKTEEDLDAVDDGWRIAGNGKPIFYFCPTPNIIQFSRKSDTVITAGIVVRVAVKPTEASTGADDIIFNDWYHVIAEGAKGILMTMPGEKWSNQNQGMLSKKVFKDGIQRAKTIVKKGHSKAPTYARMKRFI